MKDASNRDWMWSTQISETDGRYLILYVSKDTSRVCASLLPFIRMLIGAIPSEIPTLGRGFAREQD